MADCAVLHVTSLLGGGVDRHVRDIARAGLRKHLVWHAGDGADVIELPRERLFLPLDGAAFARAPGVLERWLRFHGAGIVHVHSLSRACRDRAAWAAQALGTKIVVTLHDVLFLRREAFEPDSAAGPDPDWLAQTGEFIRRAASVLAPSQYIALLAREHLHGLEVAVMPNGSPERPPAGMLSPRPEFVARRPAHVAGVLGAIGPHKGSAILAELDGLLRGSSIAIVVIGYLDSQIVPGWHGEHIFVHGAYDDEDVEGLFAAYGVEIAFFPNRVPESFSYALSEAWHARLPALVPGEGALGERVARHGGGWVLPAGFDAREADRALRRLFSPEGSGDLARVKSLLALPDPGRVPPLDDMNRSLDALYARFGLEASAPVDALAPEVQDLIAKNLDGSLFRHEFARLADEFIQLRAGLERERAQATEFSEEARRWIAKLEADIAQLQSELAAEFKARCELSEELKQVAVHKSALGLLPRVVRKMLLKMINARS